MSELDPLAAEKIEDEVVDTEIPEVNDADIDNDADFSDTAEDESQEVDGEGDDDPQSTPKADEKPKPWKNTQNADAARKRREAERQAEIKKVRNETVIEATGGVNPYTDEPIEDDADVEEYLAMKAMEKEGKDPIMDYSKYLKSKQKAAAKATQEQAQSDEWIIKDREDFVKKHPTVKMDELIGDELFRTFATGKVGRVPMSRIYEDYKSFSAAFAKQSEESAKSKAAQILANNAATPGKLSAKHSNITPKSISDMTSEEFAEFSAKLERGEIKLK